MNEVTDQLLRILMKRPAEERIQIAEALFESAVTGDLPRLEPLSDAWRNALRAGPDRQVWPPEERS